MAKRPCPRAVASKNPGLATREDPLCRPARLLTGERLPVVADQSQLFIENGEDITDIRGAVANVAAAEQEIIALLSGIRGQLGDGVKRRFAGTAEDGENSHTRRMINGVVLPFPISDAGAVDRQKLAQFSFVKGHILLSVESTGFFFEIGKKK